MTDGADGSIDLDKRDHATPTDRRCVTSYPARRGYRPGVVYPPAVPTVEETIDIHCHAHENQQDAAALLRLAAQSRMKGLLFKTIAAAGTTRRAADFSPAKAVAALRDEHRSWAEENGLEPALCWSGYLVAGDNEPPDLAKVKANLADGVDAVWLPVFNHANTLSKVGGRMRLWDKEADHKAHSKPLTWPEALERGQFMMGDGGKLKPLFVDIVKAVVDADRALFFGHATRPEIHALAELVAALGCTKAVIDHPFSPFVDLSIKEMAEVAACGVTLNFTYDELSPLLGVDPAEMYGAIRAVGVEHFTLSSDAGEPLFPNSVECMRLIRGYMEAFGMSGPELRALTIDTPARIVGLA